MKNFLIIFLFFIVSCTARRPRVYPDLYEGNLLKENSIGSSFYKRSKVFWIHNFKKVVINGFSTTKKISLPINEVSLDMAKNGLSERYYTIADSIGKLAALNKTNLKFDDMIYFYDSAYLDSVAISHYKIYKRDSRLLKGSQPKINRRSHEH
jgi:hypothetical protein